MMPLWLDYLCAILGIIGFFITIITLINTIRLNKAIIETKERVKLKTELQNVVNKIDGFVNSLNEKQDDEVLYESIDSFITEISASYTFLSEGRANTIIQTLYSFYNNKDNREPHQYVKQLINLRVSILKEVD